MIGGKKILAVTLARGGSKGVSKKNIRPLGGVPLIGHTILQVRDSQYIDEYIVSTDCTEIADVAEQYGARIPFVRPAELSTDTASSASALIHAVDYLEDEEGKSFDYVVELMATNPFKTTADIDECIRQTISNGYQCGVAVHRIWDQHPSRVKMIRDNVLVDFFPEVPESRRQDLSPPAYIRSGSIYVVSTQFLRSTGARYGKNNTFAYVLDEQNVTNIDEPNDFIAAEIKLNEREH